MCRELQTGPLRQPDKFTDAAMMFDGLERIHDKFLNRLVHKLAAEAGLSFVVRPHGLRHASITRALDLTNGNIRKVMRFARHASPATTIRYDDARHDLAGDVARMIGADLAGDES